MLGGLQADAGVCTDNDNCAAAEVGVKGGRKLRPLLADEPRSDVFAHNEPDRELEAVEYKCSRVR